MNKANKCKFCNKQAVKEKMCRRHYNKAIRDVVKMIDTTRKREKAQKALHVKERRNMGY